MNIYKHLRKHKNINILFIFILLSLLSSIILFHTHTIFGGWDLGFHLRRIYELRDSFQNDNFLPMFSFNQYHGSAVMALYPYINLVPLALLSFLVKSGISLIYIWFSLSILVTLLISFYSSYSYNRVVKVSLVFSILYSTSTIFLYTYFSNMDFGVLTGLSFFPLIIFGTFNFLYKNNWIELSIGISLLIFSHVLSTLIAILFVFLFSLLNLKVINKEKIVNILKASLLSLLCTSIVWIPFIYFSLYNMNNIAKPSTIASFGTNFYKLFYDGIFNSINPYDLSFFALISIFIVFLFYKKLNIVLKKMFWLSLFIILISSNIFPWKLTSHGIFKLFGIVQFPGRLYVIPQILLIYILSVILVKHVTFHHNVIILFVLIISVITELFGQIKIINYNQNAPVINNAYIMKYVLDNYKIKLPKYKHINSRYRIITNTQLNNTTNFNLSPTFDYYPKDSISRIHYINNNEGVVNNNTANLIKVKHLKYNKFLFKDKNKSIKSLSLPFIGYNHEKLQLYVNNKLSHYHLNKYGMITISNIKTNTRNNHIYIRYIPNMFIILAEIILLFSGILWMVYIINKKRKI